MLTTGNTRSCGCLHKKIPYKTHGKRYERLYGVWAGMKNRCLNPNEPKYKNYGARGIRVCDEWLNDFEVFYEWAMENGYDADAKKNECTIDRIDVNGNYEPSNCRWANAYTQGNNKRNNIIITINNETHTVSEWSTITGLKNKTIVYRYKKGWAGEKLISPVKKRKA